MALMNLKLLRERGAALIELLIVIPLLLTLIAGMVNIGFVLWQTQLLFDAARFGAREGVVYAQTHPTTCSGADEVAFNSAKTYMQDSLGWSASRWNVVASIEEWRPNTPQVRVVQVDISIAGDRNCIFCFERIAERVSPAIRAYSPLPPYCS